MDRLPALGIWWAPPKDKRRKRVQVYGQLEGEPGNLRLNVLGGFDPSKERRVVISTTYFDDLPKIPLIHGVIRGAFVSLLDVSKSRLGHSLPGLEDFSYTPSMVVFGRHVHPGTASGPIGMNVHFSHLLAWHGSRGLVGSIATDGQSWRRQTWNYDYPAPLEWNIPGFTIALRGGLNTGRDWETLRAVEYGYFSVMSETARSHADWVQKIVDPLHEMLEFAMFSPVRLTRLRPLFADEAGNPDTGTLNSFSSDLVLNRPDTALGDTRSVRRADMLFRPDHITSDILAKLVNPSDRVNRIRARFLAYEQSALSLDDFFLAYVRQLESLHRVLFPVSSEKQQQFSERLERIAKRLTEDDAKLVSGKMSYAYEPSLAGRLHQLAKPWKPILVAVLGSKAILGSEIEQIGAHRNFLAHELSEDGRVLGGEHLDRVTLFLMVLARLVSLQQAGFSVEEAKAAVTETELYQSFCREYAATV